MAKSERRRKRQREPRDLYVQAGGRSLHRRGGKDWFYDSVKYAYEKGLMNRTATDKFSPHLDTGRSMVITIFWRLAAILWSYAGSEKALDYEGAGRFTDTQDISSWAAHAMTWALSEGVLTGKGSGILDPGGKATRAETTVILERYLAAD